MRRLYVLTNVSIVEMNIYEVLARQCRLSASAVEEETKTNNNENFSVVKCSVVTYTY